MLDLLLKIYNILDARERRNLLLLFFMMLISGLIEVMGVASVIPFLSVLSNVQIIQQNHYLSFIYNNLGFSETRSFLFFLGLVVFLMVVGSLCFKACTQYALARFTYMRSYSLSLRLLRHYLSLPYSWFLNRHSAHLGKNLLSEVQQVVNQTIFPAAQFIAHAVITVCLIGFLLIINFKVALLAAILLGGTQALIYLLLRKYLNRIGAERFQANKERFHIVQEAFGGIKEVKAGGTEAGYLNSFAKPAHRLSRCLAANKVAGQVPHFLLEAMAFGGILIIVLVLLQTGGGKLEDVLPTLGVFAFGGQRLLPALRQVYTNGTQMRFGKPSLDALYLDIKEAAQQSQAFPRTRQKRDADTACLGLDKSLDLLDIEFWYPQAERPALKDLNLSINANTTVGIVGPTGAGKTTVVDVILGLLRPDKGDIRVDGTVITPDNLSAWQRSLGYVPQQIFLSDDTVAANIAFGLPGKDIDNKAIEQAARIAELHHFVTRELPQGYETVIGERGVKLSGGQRQRIGIARALYHNPDVLLLDEATSALDNLTEKAVMQAVHNLSQKKTIIMIAHRLSTVKNCDCLFLLENGRLIAHGTYSELLEESDTFRDMAAESS